VPTLLELLLELQCTGLPNVPLTNAQQLARAVQLLKVGSSAALETHPDMDDFVAKLIDVYRLLQTDLGRHTAAMERWSKEFNIGLQSVLEITNSTPIASTSGVFDASDNSVAEEEDTDQQLRATNGGGEERDQDTSQPQASRMLPPDPVAPVAVPVAASSLLASMPVPLSVVVPTNADAVSLLQTPMSLPPIQISTTASSTLPPQSMISKKKKRRGNLPKTATATLKSWVVENLTHPYPSEDVKRQLAFKCSLSVQQISNWFINARRRIVPALQNGGNLEQQQEQQQQQQQQQYHHHHRRNYHHQQEQQHQLHCNTNNNNYALAPVAAVSPNSAEATASGDEALMPSELSTVADADHTIIAPVLSTQSTLLADSHITLPPLPDSEPG